MPDPAQQERKAAELAAEVAELAAVGGFTVAVAESLTGGKLAQVFAAVPSSSDWFAGGVVAYQPEVKFGVLGVPRGPVISEQAVRAMASGVADLMGADAVVAASGAGGPQEEEGNPPGTTWLAVLTRGHLHTELHHFAGDPLEVLAQTQRQAVQMLRDAMGAMTRGE